MTEPSTPEPHQPHTPVDIEAELAALDPPAPEPPAAEPPAAEPPAAEPPAAEPLTPRQRGGKKAAATRKKRAAKKKAADETLSDKQAAQQLAQVVNLHIGGYSLTEIADAIGSTADEVDRALARDAARYVRNQPALRTYVRNWVSERYALMLEADWDYAVDKSSPQRLENQDRALRILDSMRKLHGADAPVQSEVKVEAAPEAVEQLVNRLAGAQGLAYDVSIFDDADVVDAEIVSDVAERAPAATLSAGEAADAQQEDESDDGF